MLDFLRDETHMISDCEESETTIHRGAKQGSKSTSHTGKSRNSKTPVATGKSVPTKKKSSAALSKKDPKAPKRFRSSYIFFAKRRFQEIKKQRSLEGVPHKT